MDQQTPGQAPVSTVSTAAPHQLMSASELLERAWAKFKTHYQTYIGIFIIPFLITLILPIIFGTGLAMTRNAPAVGLGFIIYALVIAILFVLAQAAFLVAIDGHDERIGIQDAYSRALPKLTGLIVVTFLVTIFVLAGYILLIIPGIIFAIWFAFAPMVYISEGLHGTTAIWKSKSYVSGRWGGVFWRFLFIGVVYMLGALVLQLVMSVFGAKGSMIGGLLSVIYGAVLAPLMVIYQYELYKNLKSLKEQQPQQS